MPNKFGLSIISFGKALWYEKDDVICFKGNDGRYYSHRIVSVDLINGLVTTKGDNFSESKPYEINIPFKNIQGLVTWSYPKLYQYQTIKKIDERQKEKSV